MPRFDRPFCSLEELHETQLDIFKTMFLSEVVVAVPAALHYCAEHDLVTPAWFTKASADLHCITLRSDTPKKRGRASSHVARYRQDMIDFVRWDEICVVQDNQRQFRRQVAELRALPKVPRHMLKEQEKMLDWLGKTLIRAYECASMNLAKTEAFGGPDAMKKSYRLVEKNSKDPQHAMRYHVFDPQFLRKLGLKASLDVPQGKKFVPLYDLTPR